MPNKPTTVPTLDTNQTNRTIPAPTKVTDGYVLNDLLPAANLNYLVGWAGDWLTWLDGTFNDGVAAGDLSISGDVAIPASLDVGTDLTVGGLATFGTGPAVTIPAAGDTVQFSNAGANYITASAAAGELFFRTGGTTNRVVIDNLGDVGIGTDTPQEQLDVRGNIRFDVSGSDRGLFGYASSTFINSFTRIGNNAIIKGFSGVGLWTGASAGETSGTRHAFLNSTGYLGLGPLFDIVSPFTNAIDSRLHVQQAEAGVSPVANTLATFEDDGDLYISLLTPSGDESGLMFGDAADADIGRLIYDHSDNSMGFWAAAAKRMTLTSDGLLIRPGAASGITVPASHLVIDDDTWARIDLLSDGTSGPASMFFYSSDHAAPNTAYGSFDWSGNTSFLNWVATINLASTGQPRAAVARFIGDAPNKQAPGVGWVEVNSLVCNNVSVHDGSTSADKAVSRGATGVLEIGNDGTWTEVDIVPANVTLVGSSTTGTPTTAAGWVEIKVGATTRWIQCYSTSP